MPIKETRDVPSDIDIAQAHELKPITEIMEMIGLTEERTDNTLEVRIGGLEYATRPEDRKLLH